MSRIKIQCPPGAAGVVRLGGPEGNEGLDQGRESRMGGDERGQDADPLVHAVRVRDVLQLDGLGALLGDLPELGHDLTVAGIAGR